MGIEEKQHTDQARRNYKVFQCIAPSYVDWATTVLFYTALHVVEAWLHAHTDWRGGRHKQRETKLASLNGVTDDVYEAYETLKDASVLARYEVWQGILDATTLRELHDVQYQLICDHFEAPDQIVPSD